MNLGEIQNLARAKADEQNTGDFIGETELVSYVNQGLRFIYAQITQKWEDFFVLRGTSGNGGLFSLVIGQDEYALPATLQKLTLVQMRIATNSSNDAWITLNRVNPANDGDDTYYPLRNDLLYRSGYYVAGNNLYIQPVPTEALQIRLHFIPRVTALAVNTDIPGIPEEYHEILAEYAAIHMLRKSGEGIFNESYKIWMDELKNLLSTVAIRNTQAGQMTITENYDEYYYGW